MIHCTGGEAHSRVLVDTRRSNQINELINQSINQLVNQSDNQSTSQLVNQPVRHTHTTTPTHTGTPTHLHTGTPTQPPHTHIQARARTHTHETKNNARARFHTYKRSVIKRNLIFKLSFFPLFVFVPRKCFDPVVATTHQVLLVYLATCVKCRLKGKRSPGSGV